MIFLENKESKIDFKLEKDDMIILSVKNNYRIDSAFEQLERHIKQLNRLIPDKRRKFFLLLLCKDESDHSDYSIKLNLLNKYAAIHNSRIIVGIIRNEMLFDEDLNIKYDWTSFVKNCFEEFSKNKSQFVGVNTRITNIEQTLTTFQNNLNTINTKITSLENNFSSLNRNQRSFDARLNTFETKLDSVENKVVLFGQNLGSFKNSLGSFSKDLGSFKQDLSSYGTRLSNIETKLGSIDKINKDSLQMQKVVILIMLFLLAITGWSIIFK